MSRFVNISVIIIGALFILKMAGVQTGADDVLIKFGLGTAGSISMSAFLLSLGAIYATAAGAGIIIGYFTKASFEWAVIATSIAQLAVLYGSIDSLMSLGTALPYWGSAIVYAVWGILGVLYVWSAFEFTFNR